MLLLLLRVVVVVVVVVVVEKEERILHDLDQRTCCVQVVAWEMKYQVKRFSA